MAATKTFQTQFLIGATWTGQRGVQQAQRQMSGLAKHVQTAGVRVKGMARSVFAGVGAQRLLEGAVRNTIQVLEKSFAAASEAQEAHDDLTLSFERNANRYKSLAGKSVAESTRIINESTQALISASEQMEKTGHDAETLQKGFARLGATGALDPKQILEQREAFSDVLSYISGANATAEESANLGELWADAILRGNQALLKQMDLSSGELAQFRAVEKQIKKGDITAEQGIKKRQDLVLKFAKKFKGETERVFEKPSGKIAQMWTQVGNVLETIGEPFIARAPEISTAFSNLAKDVKPAADEMARITAEGLKGISTWFSENKEEIPKWFKFVEEGLERVYNLLTLIQKVPVLFDLPAAIKRWMQPARLGQLPGAPNQVVNPALAQGEAGRRAREAQEKAEATDLAQRQWGGTGRYYSGPQEAKAVAAPEPPSVKAAEKAAEEFYKPGGPSAMPGKIGATGPTQAQAIANAQQAVPVDAKLTAQVLAEAQNRNIPAAIRHRNPGAQWPSRKGGASYRFGQIGEDVIGGGNKIATFPTATHGAASNMATLAEKYVGMKIGGSDPRTSAMMKWSGSHRQVPGPGGNFDLSKVITREMVNDPDFVIPFMKAIANAEAPGGARALSDAQWRQAYDWYRAGAPGGTAPTASLRNQTRGLGGRGAGGPTNISMNAPITVNGVAPGREALMAKKTSLAMRDPVQQLLSEIRAAQKAEARLVYT